MPGTAQQLGVNDAFRPDQNIAGGTTYLDQLLDRYDPNNDSHGLALALAAYNAGPAAVDRYHGIPPYAETRAYVVRVMTEFKRRKLALEHEALEHTHTTLPSPNASQNVASLGSH
jgi:soluble lytic murein transglycosylase-like protein